MGRILYREWYGRGQHFMEERLMGAAPSAAWFSVSTRMVLDTGWSRSLRAATVTGQVVLSRCRARSCTGPHATAALDRDPDSLEGEPYSRSTLTARVSACLRIDRKST